MLSSLGRALLSLLAGCLLACPAWAGSTYKLTPSPAWVAPLPAGVSQQKPAVKAGAASAFYPVYDRQIRLGPQSQESYTHVSKKILTTTGLQDQTELSFDFDPGYQELEIHSVELVRGEASVDVLARGRIKVIQQEQELDQRIYNGTLTALVFLEGLRVGDVIDYAFTVKGQNPVMDGRFVANCDLAFDDAVGYLRYRLTSPKGREIGFKTHGGASTPKITQEGDDAVYLWEKSDVAPVHPDGDLPIWYSAYPWVQLSEFATWSEVAGWASRLYEVSSEPGPEVERLAAKLRKGQTLETAALKAIRFVQDEVRYLGLETGVNTHRPHPPSAVLAQRFGDCKDKSTLLVALLRQLGLEACPALVNTEYDQVLEDYLPSPFTFDHVIVWINWPSSGILVDATASLQGGRLSKMAQPYYHRALLVRPGSRALTAFKEPTRTGAKHVNEEYRLDPTDAGSAIFTVRTEHFGWQADSLRSQFASSPLEQIGKNYLNYYAKTHDRIEASGLPQVRDDRDSNVFVVTETYRIPGFWNRGDFEVRAWAIDELLPNPETRVRTMPLGVNHPVEVRHTVSIPRSESHDAGGEETVEGGCFRMVRTIRPQADRLNIDYLYKSKRGVIQLAELDQSLKVIERARRLLTFQPDKTDPIAERRPDLYVGWTLVGLATIGGGYWGARRFKQRVSRLNLRRRLSVSAGETAGSAIAVHSKTEMEARLNNSRCECGSPASGLSREYHTAIYEDQRLTVVTEHCLQCKAERARYFQLLTVAE